MQTRKHTSKESTLALKPRVDPGKSITLVLVDKQKELMSSNFFVKNKKENNSPYVCHSNAAGSRTSRWRRHHLCIFCNFLNNPLKVKKYDPYKSYVNEKPPPQQISQWKCINGTQDEGRPVTLFTNNYSTGVIQFKVLTTLPILSS